MENIIKLAERQQISNIQLGNKNVIIYDNIDKNKVLNLNDLLNNRDFIYLYLQVHDGTDLHAHWVLIYKNKGMFYYYDPYGLSPEIDLQITGESSLLLSLIKNTKERVHINRYQYQAILKDHETCGRHCYVRQRFRNFSPEQYHSIMNNKKILPDDLVSILTLFIFSE